MNNKKILISWAFYDWASSAFPVIVTTFIFATYFTTKVAVNEIIGTYQWASATAIAGVIIAILSPVFGAISDYSGHHKRWLLFFTFMCVISCFFLWFAYPSPHFVFFTLFCVVLGTIGLEVATVFYNSLLPHIAPKNYLGRISGWAWGLGYLGGIVALSISLFIFIDGKFSWLNPQTFAQIRICGPLTAIWFALFSLPLFLSVPDTHSSGLSIKNAVKQGLKDLYITLKSLPQQKNILLFLIAHLIYVDGLNTLFAFGGIYAAGTFGMSFAEVVLFGITMNITAGIGAIFLAWTDDLRGSRFTILISIICLVVIGFPLLFIHSKIVFWILALSLGTFVGPVQAASRSLMARLVSLEKSTEMFGLYALSGKITAFIGPWVLGSMTLHFNTQRAGMASILVFFIVGGCLMWFVKEPEHSH